MCPIFLLLTTLSLTSSCSTTSLTLSTTTRGLRPT
uniref:Uncharacterized protein n=1 Tax=Anguilla anguilla TaxID=7936 RepID=A0A0E9XK77_ANGAN